MSIVEELKQRNPEIDYTINNRPEDTIKECMNFLEKNMEFFIKETLNNDRSKRNWDWDYFKSSRNFDKWKEEEKEGSLRLYCKGVRQGYNYDVIGQCWIIKSFLSTKKQYRLGLTFPCFVVNRTELGESIDKDFSLIECINFQTQVTSFLKQKKWGFKEVKVKVFTKEEELFGIGVKTNKKKTKLLSVFVSF